MTSLSDFWWPSSGRGEPESLSAGLCSPARDGPTEQPGEEGGHDRDDRGHEEPRDHHDEEGPDDLVLRPQIRAVVADDDQDQEGHCTDRGGEDAGPRLATEPRGDD